ncbi:MAG: DUF1552 domain-containing protein [Planctomycetota bacterium]|nr:DUF1552 domain-containing protein [Planctomycetota bacterium]
MSKQHSISRRTVLRGLGASFALPFLEAMSPVAAAAEAAPASPVRLAFCFVPNGVNLKNWVPQGAGSDYKMPWSLQPLSAVKDDLLVLTGLTHDKGRANGDGAGDHARSASVFLTGAQPVKTHGSGIRVGMSIDQLAARKIGDQTKFASLELGCDGGRNSGNCDSGYSCAYSNNISWTSEITPNSKEVDPRRAFDRLFGNGKHREEAENKARRLSRRISILDFVLEDARRLNSRLGSHDQGKVDEYFSGVRDLEKRLARVRSANSATDIVVPDGLPDAPGRRMGFKQHVNLMTDLMVLAFQADVTRVSSLMFARAGSNRSYREVSVPDGHHGLSHHQGNESNLEKIRRIDRFHVEQFAYFVEKLKSVREGEGTLLDNCMVLYGSGISDGNRHNNENLPLLMAGRGGGSVDTGRHIVYEHETPVCNLFVSMLERAGASVDSFGDSTGALRYLST